MKLTDVIHNVSEVKGDYLTDIERAIIDAFEGYNYEGVTAIILTNPDMSRPLRYVAYADHVRAPILTIDVEQIKGGYIVARVEANILFEGLPEIAYVKPFSEQKTVMVKRGESGYYNLKEEYKHMSADSLNAQIGVSKAQAEAMYVGSLFGWDVPGANPELYDEDGKMKKEDH